MGVKDLWGILGPVMQHVPLVDLRGQTLAVDLSIWVVETQGVRQMQGVVTKPHLRNLFFRASHLLQLGIDLVFVIEGEAPQLKYDTMAQRTETRYGARGRGRSQPATGQLQRKPKRSQFKAVLRECCQLLDHIGVPYVQAAGEAEAMCALLNAAGIVDGCLTDDGDAFLYGAKKVYRNFTMNTKDPHVESYSMDDIKTSLGLDRQGLVGLALLLGCDYLPKGVPGVGREMALKLFTELSSENILVRFQSWTTQGDDFWKVDQHMSSKKLPHCNVCAHPGSVKEHQRGGCQLCGSTAYCEPQAYDYHCPCDWHVQQTEVSRRAAELTVRRKALSTPGFPWPQVSREFLCTKDKLLSAPPTWKRPSLSPFQLFSEAKMEWVREYGREKLLPLLTLWDMKAHLGLYRSSHHHLLEPHIILKARVRQGIDCFEVEWYKQADDHSMESDYYTTVEEAALFQKCFPLLVEEHNLKKSAKTTKRKGKTQSSQMESSEKPDKEKVDMKNISNALHTLSLNHTDVAVVNKSVPSTEIKLDDKKKPEMDRLQLKEVPEDTHVNMMLAASARTEESFGRNPSCKITLKSSGLQSRKDNNLPSSTIPIGSMSEEPTERFERIRGQELTCKSVSRQPGEAPVLTLEDQSGIQSDGSSEEDDGGYVPLSQRLGLGSVRNLEAKMAASITRMSQDKKVIQTPDKGSPDQHTHHKLNKGSKEKDLHTETSEKTAIHSESKLSVCEADTLKPRNMFMSIVRKLIPPGNSLTKHRPLVSVVKKQPLTNNSIQQDGTRRSTESSDSTLSAASSASPTDNVRSDTGTDRSTSRQASSGASTCVEISSAHNHARDQTCRSLDQPRSSESSSEHCHLKVIRKTSKSRSVKQQNKRLINKHRAKLHEAVDFSSDDESLLFTITESKEQGGTEQDRLQKHIPESVNSYPQENFTPLRNPKSEYHDGTISTSSQLSVATLDRRISSTKFEQTCGVNIAKLSPMPFSESHSFELFDNSCNVTNSPVQKELEKHHDQKPGTRGGDEENPSDECPYNIENTVAEPTCVDIDTPCTTPVMTNSKVLSVLRLSNGSDTESYELNFDHLKNGHDLATTETNPEVYRSHLQCKNKGASGCVTPNGLHEEMTRTATYQSNTSSLAGAARPQPSQTGTKGGAYIPNISVWNDSQIGKFEIESSLLNISVASSTAATPPPTGLHNRTPNHGQTCAVDPLLVKHSLSQVKRVTLPLPSTFGNSSAVFQWHHRGGLETTPEVPPLPRSRDEEGFAGHMKNDIGSGWDSFTCSEVESTFTDNEINSMNNKDTLCSKSHLLASSALRHGSESQTCYAEDAEATLQRVDDQKDWTGNDSVFTSPLPLAQRLQMRFMKSSGTASSNSLTSLSQPSVQSGHGA